MLRAKGFLAQFQDFLRDGNGFRLRPDALPAGARSRGSGRDRDYGGQVGEFALLIKLHDPRVQRGGIVCLRFFVRGQAAHGPEAIL